VRLQLSAALHDLGEVQAIDACGYERHSASRHDANRVDSTFEAVSTSTFVDCETGVMLDVDCSMKQPHDTQIAWQVLTRTLDQLKIVVADKGYDWDALRQKLREAGVRPIIKHREFYPPTMAHDTRHDEDVYHLRSNAEAVFFALRHRFGETLLARTWLGQYRELVLKSAVRNMEFAVSHSQP